MAKKVKYVEVMDVDQIWEYLKEGKDLVFFDINNFNRTKWVSQIPIENLRAHISSVKNENQDNSKHFFLEVVEDE